MRCCIVVLVLLSTTACVLGRVRWTEEDPVAEESFEEQENDSLETYHSAVDKQLDMESTTAQLSARTVELEDTVKSLEEVVKTVRSKNAVEVSGCHERIAFHAVIDLHDIAHLGINQHILFGTVLLNIKNGHNPSHGMFTAPTSGVYMFSASLLSSNEQSTLLFAADIVKNGALLARLYGRGVLGFHDQGSATVVTSLKVGDHVWVRFACCANDALFGRRYSTFSGALIA